MRVLITGSTRGFGLELAKAFANKGHDIILNGRNDLTFKTEWQYCKCDSRNLVADFIGLYKPDVIINNAFDKSDCLGSLAGQINTLKESLKYFTNYSRGGIIININSSKGLIPDIDFPEYATAKYGLRGYSESVKFEAYKKAIHILDLYPGAINVGMSDYRDDKDKIIDAKELSEFIVMLCDTKTFVCSTIHFNRKYLANDIK